MKKGFGSPLKWQPKITIERSTLTQKWLVILHFDGVKRCISPHWDKQDAKDAAERVRTVFGGYSPKELRNSETWSLALQSLDYEDDGEIVSIIQDGQVYTDPAILAQVKTQIDDAIAAVKDGTENSPAFRARIYARIREALANGGSHD